MVGLTLLRIIPYKRWKLAPAFKYPFNFQMLSHLPMDDKIWCGTKTGFRYNYTFQQCIDYNMFLPIDSITSNSSHPRYTWYRVSGFLYILHYNDVLIICTHVNVREIQYRSDCTRWLLKSNWVFSSAYSMLHTTSVCFMCKPEGERKYVRYH